MTEEFDWVDFSKKLDHGLAQFIEENMTYESGKTMTDFNVMEFAHWVTKRRDLQKKE